MAAQRRIDPTDDLCTALVQAEVDGERLTDAEVASFFILLTAAGNETTAHAITRGVLQLTVSSGPAGAMVDGIRCAGEDRRRGNRPMGLARHLHAPASDGGHRDRRPDTEGR